MENSTSSRDPSEIARIGRQMQVLSKTYSPFDSLFSADYISDAAVELENCFKPTESLVHHHRACSNSFIEEQVSWLDELLKDPESPVRIGHRRSISDSIAYLDTDAKFFTEDFNVRDCTAASHNYHLWQSSLEEQQNLSGSPLLQAGFPMNANCLKQDLHTAELSARNDCVNANPSASRTDTKRTKQQMVHRSRERKLQYIADLERNVQFLQAEGAQISAQLQYLDQQFLILGLENRALKQRLDSLSQEHLIKNMEHNMLERELGRLQFVYNQQQQQQQQRKYSTCHHRSKSRDLDCQFANLAMREPLPPANSLSGSLHI